MTTISLGAPKRFNESKKILRDKVYSSKGKTFYCNCDYQKRSIKLKKCGLNIKKYKKRQKRLEWEHVVPAHAFGKSFREWREAKIVCKQFGKKFQSGRKCANKLSSKFRSMAADVHNIVPVIGAINALRSNFSFQEIKGNEYSLCQAGFMLKKRKASPPINKRGDVARIYLYMDHQYPGHGILNKKRKELFIKWDKEDPVDNEECRINTLKESIQGNKNPFISQKCTK